MIKIKTPSVWYTDDLQNWDTKMQDKKTGRWVCARPESYNGIFFLWRFRLAWKVFIGHCDALTWKAGQSKL